jgi:DUF4097 and DUF4098 domain-containing protein YvlB
MFGEIFDYGVVDSDTPTGKTPHLVIDNPKGSILVTGADVSSVKVTGRKNIRAIDRATADKANQNANLSVEKAGETVTITTRTAGIQDSVRVAIDIEVTVPRGSSVEARGQTGDFDVREINGDVSVYSDNAGVRAQNLAGRLKVETRKSDIIRASGVKGDVELKGRGRDIELEDIAGQVTIDGSYSGETTLRRIAKSVRFESNVTQLHVERIPGEMQLGLTTLNGNDLVGPMTIKTETKDIHLADVTDSLVVDLESGDVEITQRRNPVPRIDVHVTRAGQIELALPAQSKVTLSAETRHGEINNDLDEHLKQAEGGNGAKLEGSLGGPTEVKVITERGEVTLRKSEPVAPSAPAPAAVGALPKNPKMPKMPLAPPEKVVN